MENTGSMSSPEIHRGPHERVTAIINPNKGPIMKPFLALVFSFVLLFCGCGPASTPADAITEIKKLGGKVRLNKSGEAISVILKNTQVTDAGMEHLKGMTSLEYLTLNGTQVTDAGMEHFKGLTNLNTLSLNVPKITDAGMEHLKGLTSLRDFALTGTQITDAGLEHLKDLTSLRILHLGGTQVTAAGLSELKAALPKCNVVTYYGSNRY